jgi:hypothetical protein
MEKIDSIAELIEIIQKAIKVCNNDIEYIKHADYSLEDKFDRIKNKNREKTIFEAILFLITDTPERNDDKND